MLFRTAPSDALQGELAGQMAANTVETVSLVYVDNAYGLGLAENFKTSFEAAGGRVIALVPVEEAPGQSYAAELRSALGAERPDTLAAYTYPDHARVYLREAIELYNYRNFMFADGTKSPELVRAIGGSNLEGLMGTAPGAVDSSGRARFLLQYTERYGAPPAQPFIENSYDAMALIGLAAFRARSNGEEVTGTTIRDNLGAVANPPGVPVGPGQFQRAFDLISRGQDINHEGAAGAQDFDANGDVQTPIEVCQVSGGSIETVRTVDVE